MLKELPETSLLEVLPVASLTVARDFTVTWNTCCNRNLISSQPLLGLAEGGCKVHLTLQGIVVPRKGHSSFSVNKAGLYSSSVLSSFAKSVRIVLAFHPTMYGCTLFTLILRTSFYLPDGEWPVDC